LEFGYFVIILLGFFLFLRFFIPFLLGVEIAAALDVVTHSETPVNTSYIVACCTFDERIDIKAIISKINERAFLHPCHRKLQKLFRSFIGIYYWRKDPHFSLENHIEVLNTYFYDNDELYQFMNKQASQVRFPKNMPEWKFFLVPNMPYKKSGIILKIHHGISDGLSLMNYVLNLGDSKEYGLVHLPKISKCRWILIYLIGLIEILKFAVKVIIRKKDDNLFKNERMLGKKNSYCSEALDLTIIKNYAKHLGISVNAIFLALLAKAVNNCYLRIFQKDLKNFSLMIAVSTLPMPAKNQIYPLGNNITFMPQDIINDKPEQNFQDYVLEYHKTLKSSKTDYSIYIQRMAGTFVYHILPACVNEFLMNYLTNNHSGIYTSFPGPTTPVSLFGYEVKDLCFFVTGIGQTRMVYNIMTYNGKFNLACSVDESTNIDCKVLIEEFQKLVENLTKKENGKTKFNEKALLQETDSL